MLNDQAQNKAMLNVMSLVTEDAIDPHIVQSTITEYQYGKTNTDLVRELLDDALEESEEEEAEAEGGNKNFTQQDNARVETLMRLNTDLVNHKLLDNMPIIGEINPAKVLDMNQDEMLKNNSNATRELEQFLGRQGAQRLGQGRVTSRRGASVVVDPDNHPYSLGIPASGSR
jgi:hypothetical protein